MILNFKEEIKNSHLLLSNKMEIVNKEIISLMQSDVELIPQIANHLIMSGGKRIRPLVTLLSSSMFEYKGNKDTLLAACVEFIHTATLLHDDVVDESSARRGQLSSNAIWGNKSSVLVGDFLFSKSFELMVRTENLEILRVLSNASSIIAQGEVLQLSNINNKDLSFNTYIEIITAKTAALFSAAAKVGALLSLEKTHEYVNYINDFALNLGIAFQIIDDILDYKGNLQETGKSLGTDLNEGKITLPVIYAFQDSDKTEKEILENIFVNGNVNENDINKVMSIISKYDGFNKSLAVATEYVENSISCINKINVNNVYKDTLVNIAKSSLSRLN